MRPVAAIIEPAFDLAQAARDIAKSHVEYQDGERALQASEQKTNSLRQAQQRRRLNLGRKLIEAKAGTPHGGWLPFLEKLRIESRTATNWMREAGYVDGKSESNDDDSDLNPRIAAGIDKRPRKRDEEPDDGPRSSGPSTAPKREPAPLDLGRELSRFHDILCTLAEKVPANDRKRIAHELRETARLIEDMP